MQCTDVEHVVLIPTCTTGHTRYTYLMCFIVRVSRAAVS